MLFPRLLPSQKGVLGCAWLPLGSASGEQGTSLPMPVLRDWEGEGIPWWTKWQQEISDYEKCLETPVTGAQTSFTLSICKSAPVPTSPVVALALSHLKSGELQQGPSGLQRVFSAQYGGSSLDDYRVWCVFALLSLYLMSHLLFYTSFVIAHFWFDSLGLWLSGTATSFLQGSRERYFSMRTTQ